MKVCTDACLFGAIVANQKTGTHHCLDIGTGTGLLSLMFAQKNYSAQIDAVEIDAPAAIQAKENINNSPWANRIKIFNLDILSFKSEKKYDCIISNPPFFENNLQSPDAAINKARHNSSLSLLQLIQIANTYLANAGCFAVLLPCQLAGFFIAECNKYNLFLSRQVLVKQTNNHLPFRSIIFFKKEKLETQFAEITIKDKENIYTETFTAALKDYYLYM